MGACPDKQAGGGRILSAHKCESPGYHPEAPADHTNKHRDSATDLHGLDAVESFARQVGAA